MTATLMNPTDLKSVRDAVLDSAGTLGRGGRRHRRGLGRARCGPSTRCSTCAR